MTCSTYCHSLFRSDPPKDYGLLAQLSLTDPGKYKHKQNACTLKMESSGSSYVCRDVSKFREKQQMRVWQVCST
jgi:hypothetical protein